MKLNTLQLNLAVGQEIAVGKHDDLAKITKIEYFPNSGEFSINTTRGPRKVLTFKLVETANDIYDCAADKYRQHENKRH